MNEDIEKILNKLENSIKEPVFLGEDYYTGEGLEEPNFFCLDPTTNDCKTLFNYIEQLQNNWNELKKWLENSFYWGYYEENLTSGWIVEIIKSKMQELEKK